MSVLMTLVVDGDAAKLERLASENADGLRAILAKAQEAGVIAHRFFGSDDRIMVVDEWPDAESFRAFFAAMEHEIGPMMAQVSSGEPRIDFWRELDTPDKLGWGA